MNLVWFSSRLGQPPQFSEEETEAQPGRPAPRQASVRHRTECLTPTGIWLSGKQSAAKLLKLIV